MRCGVGVIGMGRYDKYSTEMYSLQCMHCVTLGSVVMTTSFPFVSHCCASGFEFRTFA